MLRRRIMDQCRRSNEEIESGPSPFLWSSPNYSGMASISSTGTDEPSSIADPLPKNVYKDPDDGRKRFLLNWRSSNVSLTPLTFIVSTLSLLELLQNANFRNAMAHPANKELTHRQQFYFWKNYRNNRLQHILPTPLPEAAAVPPASGPFPPQILPTSSTSAITAASAPVSVPAATQVLSPLQHDLASGSNLPKNDPRSSGLDRRKRKKDG